MSDSECGETHTTEEGETFYKSPAVTRLANSISPTTSTSSSAAAPTHSLLSRTTFDPETQACMTCTTPFAECDTSLRFSACSSKCTRPCCRQCLYEWAHQVIDANEDRKKQQLWQRCPDGYCRQKVCCVVACASHDQIPLRDMHDTSKCFICALDEVHFTGYTHNEEYKTLLIKEVLKDTGQLKDIGVIMEEKMEKMVADDDEKSMGKASQKSNASQRS